MTPEQILSRTRDALRVLVWPGTANKVFGPSSVYVVGDTPIMALSQYAKPCAFVVDQGTLSHDEHPGLQIQNFTIMLFVENIAQNYGEGGVLGRNRVPDTSSGAGLKAIEKEVLTDLVKQITLSTDKVVLVSKNISKSAFIGHNVPLYFASLVFNAYCWSVY